MDILKDLGIGVPSGLKGADKQSLIDVVNKGLLNESSLKTNVINALNNVNTYGTKLSTSALWGDVLASIPNINTGKKWASGTQAISSGTNTQTTLTITGLSFRPSIVIVVSTSLNDTNSFIQHALGFDKNSIRFGNSGTLRNAVNSFDSSNIRGSVVHDYLTITNDGFSFILRNYIELRSFAGTYNWYAFE